MPVPEGTSSEVLLNTDSQDEAAKDVSLILPEEPKKAGSIKVMATRPGFYGNDRKKEGALFTIQSEQEMGDWMKKI